MMNPLREPHGRYREGNRALKSALCLRVSNHTFHNPLREARFHRRWHHMRGVVSRNAAGGQPLAESGVVAGTTNGLPGWEWKIHMKRRSPTYRTRHPQSAPERLDPVD